MTSNQESDDIVNDRFIGHFLPRLRVSSLQHGGEEVVPVVVRLSYSLAEHGLRRLAHNVYILVELGIAASVEHRRQGNPL